MNNKADERPTDVKPRALSLINRGVGGMMLLALFVACAGSTTISTTDSGIQGNVSYGPTCPVQRVGGPSCRRPYSAEIIIRQGDRIVTNIRSGANGSFRVTLPPGTYTIASAKTGLPTLAPFDVAVRPHAFTTITVMFDSGVR